MMRYHYNKELIVGTICAGGSLGTIIPPSVVAVVLGPVADVSVGDLLVGMIFPGLIMAGSYIVYILASARSIRRRGRASRSEEDDPPLSEKLRITAVALVPPMFMIFAVLGSLMLGWAAPTEAAGLGAFGSVLLTLFYRTFSWQALHESIMKTLTISTMIMTILLGGSMMTGAFVGAGGIMVTQDLVEALKLGPWGLLGIVLFLAFLGGFFLDWISLVLILVPIFSPLLKASGIDMVWFCILFLVVIQTSYLSPPMAPAIFYFRAISPPEITTAHMYRGVIPFIMLQVVTLGDLPDLPGRDHLAAHGLARAGLSGHERVMETATPNRGRTREPARPRRPRGGRGRAPASSEPIASLSERAYRRLEEMIVTLQLAPGSVVSETALSKRLGIGRTPIREALQQLARERLVVVLPRRGIMVSEINVRTQLRLLEARRELERLIAQRAARRASDGGTDALSRGRRKHGRGGAQERRHRLPAPRPRVQRPDAEGLAQRVRGRRDDAHAGPVAALLVHPPQGSRRPAGHRAPACGDRAGDRRRRRGPRRPGLGQADRLCREMRPRDRRGRRLIY